MKKILLPVYFLCCLLLAGPGLQAQEFAPIGATWCYHGDIKYFGYSAGPANSWTDNLVVESDTVVAGVACRKIVARRDERKLDQQLISNSIVRDYFVYDNTDTVFLYSEHLEKFIPLYVFSASEQDTICLPVPQPEYTGGITDYCIVIDSIRLENFGDIPLRSFYSRSLFNDEDHASVNFGHHTYGANGGYSMGRYTEQLGGTWPLISGLFPVLCVHSAHMAIRPGFPNGDLSYYSTPTTSISLSARPCDSVFNPLSLSERQLSDVRVSVFPNPASAEAVVHLSKVLSTAGTVRLINVLGQTLQSVSIPAGQQTVSIPLHHVSGGMYLVEVTVPYGRLTHKLLVELR
jgi:hypothetical protein